MNDVDFPVDRVLEGIDAARGGRAAGEGELRRQARRQRGRRSSPLARYFRGTGAHPALHRVHGRRRHERLADGRRRPRRRDRRADRRRVPDRAGRRRTTAARSPSAGATWTARARSASSPRSRSRSAATARARASRPRASSTPASSPCAATTCARCSAAARPTKSSPAKLAEHLARAAATATPSSARTRDPRSASRKVEMCYIGG